MKNQKTGLCFRDDFLKHDTGSGHPETYLRLQSILDHLTKQLSQRDFEWISDFKEATPAQISAIHNPDYIRMVANVCKQNQKGYLDGDTIYSPHSYTAAALATGAGIHLADQILSGSLKNGMALVRPPGHHAESDFAMGFCIFNNIAVTAKYLLSKGIKKVLIFDWDVHHGNGTQHQFYEDDSVYFVSMHQFPFYPGTGKDSERGEGKGYGTTLNLPLARSSTEFDYFKHFSVIHKEMEKFQPEFVLVSAGFDAHKEDPLGGMELGTNSFERFTSELLNIANTYAKGRMISFLEGGYHLAALAESVGVHLNRMASV
ncbi:histone deacetylase [Leptospira sp. 96542]|nr:histone deacetylase [Leptospira sp. 96542]